MSILKFTESGAFQCGLQSFITYTPFCAADCPFRARLANWKQFSGLVATDALRLDILGRSLRRSWRLNGSFRSLCMSSLHYAHRKHNTKKEQATRKESNSVTYLLPRFSFFFIACVFFNVLINI